MSQWCDVGSLAKPSPGDRDKATVGFLKPSSVSSRIGSSTPLGNRTTNLKREGGIKVRPFLLVDGL